MLQPTCTLGYAAALTAEAAAGLPTFAGDSNVEASYRIPSITAKMKNQQIRDAQAIMARSPPQILMTMQQTTNHYKKEDHFLKQTLNSCLSGPVDLQRPEKLELSMEVSGLFPTL